MLATEGGSSSEGTGLKMVLPPGIYVKTILASFSYVFVLLALAVEH